MILSKPCTRFRLIMMSRMWRYSTSATTPSPRVEYRLRRPTHLVLDWDSTLTTRDTMDQLGKLPQERDARIKRSQITSAINGDAVPISESSEHRQDWEYFFNAYMKDYVSHKKKFHPKAGGPRELCDYLASLRPIEQRSVDRVGDSRFFRGVKACDVIEVAQSAIRNGDVQLRRYWVELFEMFIDREDGSQITILSVNWSATFIRSCMRIAASKLQIGIERKNKLTQYIDDMTIMANELEDLTAPEGSTGRIVGGIYTSTDKRSKMPLSTRSKSDLASIDWRKDEDLEPYVFYIGDSATDYESILAADFGLWLEAFNNEHELPNFNKTFGGFDIGATVLSNGTWETDGKNWWMIANNFEEMACFLDRLKHQ
ncbi:Hypothetical protein R9X50_00398600 [Acrodontium crateriforme]|uniref:Uncharacterized protein n=1 Tax=Acrodontium crateriforme TaxID=150365 RepID=A0AAQ3M767_9PEZI|nr:Hypothetical protein R9X50_00398600 [Acrodontium crateriforme]